MSKAHPASLVGLIDVVEAHEHASALWGFLETTHQQLYGNAEALSPPLQAIVDANRQEVDAVLAISRRLDEIVEEVATSYFAEEETSEEERDEVSPGRAGSWNSTRRSRSTCRIPR